MIYLSASSIKDYMECNKRFEYRLKNKNEAETTDAMEVGTVVHYAIEKFWNDEDKALKYVESHVSHLKESYSSKATRCIEEFFRSFQDYLTDFDEIEKLFSIKYDSGVKIVGKLDRVVNAKIVFDWKTSWNKPKTISDDIQFIIYNEAFNSIYGYYPQNVYYAHLLSGRLVRYIKKDELVGELYNKIIPNILENMDGTYPRTGLYKGVCNRCSFFDYCYKELGDQYELDSEEHNIK